MRRTASVVLSIMLLSMVGPAVGPGSTAQCNATGDPNYEEAQIAYDFNNFDWSGGSNAAYLTSHEADLETSTDSAASDWNSCSLEIQKETPADVEFQMFNGRGPSGRCGGASSSSVTYYSFPPTDPDNCRGVETFIALHEWGHVLGINHVPSGCSNWVMEDQADGSTDGLHADECTWAENNYSGEEPESPLVFNLDGREIETTNVDREPVFFDIDNDSVVEQVGWIAANSADAFLWLDLDSNGQVNNGGELFGNGTVLPNGEFARHGFEALAAYDANADARITPADRIWPRLALWNDWDHDAVVSPNEVSLLVDTDISGISVRSNARRWRDDAGNLHYRVGVFWRNNGERGRVEDVWFETRNVSELVLGSERYPGSTLPKLLSPFNRRASGRNNH